MTAARLPLRALVLGALLVGGASMGCSVGRAMIAPSADYADYRVFRSADGLDARLTAAYGYLHEHPGGVYRELVGAWFEAAEPIYYAVRSKSPEGLEAYLSALPHGPHAEQAVAELTRARVVERVREAQKTSAELTAERIDAERAQREAVASMARTWAVLLLEPDTWRATLAEAPGELLIRYRLPSPPPECHWEQDVARHRCTRVVEQPYTVIEEGYPVSRQLRLVAELELDGGWRLRVARISGPSLFVRAAEARARRSLGAASAEQAELRDAEVELLERELLDAAARLGLGCVEQLDAGDWLLRCPERQVSLALGQGDEDDVITVEGPAR